MRVLCGITTYGSPEYVDLNLCLLKDKFKLDVVVIDDYSHSTKLQEVCNKHNVQLFNSMFGETNGHQHGDIVSTFTLLKLAKLCNYDYVLKVSRRFMCLKNPVEDLLKIAEESDGSTFSAPSIFTKYTPVWNFRTSLFAMRVNDWFSVVPNIERKLHVDGCCMAEHFMQDYAKQVQPTSDKYKNYILAHPAPDKAPKATGYVIWPFLGTSEDKLPDHLIWHWNNKITDYVKLGKELGLCYTASDFTIDGVESNTLAKNNGVRK